jgi:hypothetical protein
MPNQSILYFILIYNRADRELIIREFGDDQDAATTAYSTFEDFYRDEDREVLLVGADSLDTIRATHSQYFFSTPEHLLDDFLSSLS